MDKHGEDVDADPSNDVTQGPDNHGKRMEDHGQSVDVSDHDASSGELSDTIPFKIKLNKKAPKHGAPKKDQKKKLTSVKTTRVEYNESAKTKKAHGVVSLYEFVEKVKNDQKDIYSTLLALNGVPEKHKDHAKNKPPIHKMVRPVLTTSDFFTLPRTLVNEAVKRLPNESTSARPILACTPTGHTPPPPGNQDSVTVVKINLVGLFSAEHIMAMQDVYMLREMCEQGENFCEWLDDEVYPTVRVADRGKVEELSDNVKTLYPGVYIPGLPGKYMTSLYLIRPGEWFNDDLILAFATRLQDVYGSNRYAGVTQRDRAATKTRPAVAIEHCVQERVRELIAEGDVEFVFVAVNLGNIHWAGLTVDPVAKEIDTYDSLGAHSKDLDKIAWNMANALGGYTVKAINSPLQPDGSSCGLFICFKFWRAVDHSIPKQMSREVLNQRRFEFAYFVFSGNLLTS